MNRTLFAPLAVALGLTLAGCAGSTQGAAAPAAAIAPLDGTSYEVTLAFPGESPMKDTLRFAGGRFESTACTAVGFPQWSDYDAKVEPGAIEFSVLAKSADGTTMDWKGTVKGGNVEATAVRTMSGKTSTASVSGVKR